MVKRARFVVMHCRNDRCFFAGTPFCFFSFGEPLWLEFLQSLFCCWRCSSCWWFPRRRCWNLTRCWKSRGTLWLWWSLLLLLLPPPLRLKDGNNDDDNGGVDRGTIVVGEEEFGLSEQLLPPEEEFWLLAVLLLLIFRLSLLLVESLFKLSFGVAAICHRLRVKGTSESCSILIELAMQ